MTNARTTAKALPRTPNSLAGGVVSENRPLEQLPPHKVESADRSGHAQDNGESCRGQVHDSPLLAESPGPVDVHPVVEL